MENLKKIVTESKAKLYTGIILIFACIGLFAYLQINELTNQDLLQTNVSGVNISGLGNITYRFNTSTRSNTFDRTDLNGALEFEVILPEGIFDYFNEGETPVMTHTLSLISPTLQSYNFSYERNLSQLPFTQYSLELTDFIQDFSFLFQNPGVWRFSFNLNDKNGNQIGNPLTRSINIRSYPISLIINQVSNGLRVFWDTAFYAQQEIDSAENVSSAFTKEINLHVLSQEASRDPEDFPIGGALSVSLDNVNYRNGFEDLDLDPNETHSILMTISTSNNGEQRDLYYSTVGIYPIPPQVTPTSNNQTINQTTPTPSSSSNSSLLYQVRQALEQNNNTTNSTNNTNTQNNVQNTTSSQSQTTPNTSSSTNNPPTNNNTAPSQTQTTNTPTSNSQSTTPSSQSAREATPSGNAQSISGDINQNGEIDMEDYIVLSNFVNVDGNFSTFLIVTQSLGINFNLTQLQFLQIADINSDGDVNAGDLNTLYLQNFR